VIGAPSIFIKCRVAPFFLASAHVFFSSSFLVEKMSQFYMSQFGDELEEDALFGEFEAAWDAHSSASAVSRERTNTNNIPTHSHYTQAERNSSCRRYNMQEAY
jgi:hypothetical protein